MDVARAWYELSPACQALVYGGRTAAQHVLAPTRPTPTRYVAFNVSARLWPDPSSPRALLVELALRGESAHGVTLPPGSACTDYIRVTARLGLSLDSGRAQHGHLISNITLRSPRYAPSLVS